MRSLFRMAVWATFVGLLAGWRSWGAGVWAEEAHPAATRGEIVLARANHDWMSQQIEEPCILPNPKVP